MIQSFHTLIRHLATCLAVVAALSFGLGEAIGVVHHGIAGAVHHHAHTHAHNTHAHSHASADASDHQIIDGDATQGTDVAARDSAPASGSDDGTSCCSCTCCAAIVLPCLTAQAAPLVLVRTTPTANRRHGDGVAPDGLRRPPRPLAIA